MKELEQMPELDFTIGEYTLQFDEKGVLCALLHKGELIFTRKVTLEFKPRCLPIIIIEGVLKP